MKLKPLCGRVTVKVLEDRARIANWDTKEELNLKKMSDLAVGEVVTVGFEDVSYFTNEDGFDLVQKIPIVVKPGDKILFTAHTSGAFSCHRVLCGTESFCTIHQSSIYAVIEEN